MKILIIFIISTISVLSYSQVHHNSFENPDKIGGKMNHFVNKTTDSLKKNKIKRFLLISIDKKYLIRDQYDGFLILKDDTVIYFRQWIEQDSILKKTDTIYNKKVIKFINEIFENFCSYNSCNKCGHFGRLRYDTPYMFKGIFPSKRMKYSVGWAKNEWTISSCKRIDNGEYLHEMAFKIRLLKFRCLGLFKNLKSRKMFNKLMKYLKEYDKKPTVQNLPLHESMHESKDFKRKTKKQSQ